jgi:biopolymer transport protein ExbD
MSFGRLGPARRAEPMSEINVTPLVDVMLVLLVIFIVAAPLMAGRLALDLPRAEGTSSGLPAMALRLSVDATGAMTLDDTPVTESELRRRVQAQAARQPDAELLLQADSAVPYGTVAALIGTVQAAGLTRIGFVASPAPAATTAPR